MHHVFGTRGGSGCLTHEYCSSRIPTFYGSAIEAYMYIYIYMVDYLSFLCEEGVKGHFMSTPLRISDTTLSRVVWDGIEMCCCCFSSHSISLSIPLFFFGPKALCIRYSLVFVFGYDFYLYKHFSTCIFFRFTDFSCTSIPSKSETTVTTRN